MTAVHHDEPFTYDDLRAFPDDGYRRELVEGQLLVTAAPNTLHQRCVVELIYLLRQAVPQGLEVSAAPVDLVLKPTTVLEPDVLVVRSADVGGAFFTRPPELVVEVFSPSTRLTDLTLKRATYEAAGVPSYWLVDPEEPALTVLELEAGRYVERAHATDAQEWLAARPFPVRVVPEALVSAGAGDS